MNTALKNPDVEMNKCIGEIQALSNCMQELDFNMHTGDYLAIAGMIKERSSNLCEIVHYLSNK